MTQSNKKLIKSSIPTSIIENVILKLYEKEKGCIIKLLSSFNLSLTLIFEIGKEKLVWNAISLFIKITFLKLSLQSLLKFEHELRRTFHCSRTDTILRMTSKNVRQGYTGEPRGATSEILTKSRCQRRFGQRKFLRINRNGVSRLASSNNPQNAESTANLLISRAMKILQVTCVLTRRARLRKPTRVYAYN